MVCFWHCHLHWVLYWPSIQILLHLPTVPPSLTNWSLYCEYLLIIFLFQVYNIARKIGNENTIWVFRSTYFLRSFFQIFILFRKQCIRLQENNGYFFPLSCRLGVLKEIYTVRNSLCNFFCLGIEKHVLFLISTPLIKISEHNYNGYSLCLTFENVLLGSRSTSLESGELDLDLQVYCVSLGKSTTMILSFL